ncbi:MAG: metallopeptidase family protein [Anaerovoracaceae bacterium]
MVDIEQAQAMLDQIAEELPKGIYKELNGGILLLPQEKLSPHAIGDDLYILGEYQRGGTMGRLIYIYFGSFQRLYGYLEPAEMKDKLRETLFHEFTHHLESLAGEKDLEIEDAIKLEKYKKGK